MTRAYMPFGSCYRGLAPHTRIVTSHGLDSRTSSLRCPPPLYCVYYSATPSKRTLTTLPLPSTLLILYRQYTRV